MINLITTFQLKAIQRNKLIIESLKMNNVRKRSIPTERLK